MEKVKKECIERMEMLGLDQEMVIAPFLKGDNVMISEYLNKTFKAVLYDLGGYMDSNLINRVKAFEDKFKSKVYHIIATPTEFGYMYSLLYVNNKESEWWVDKKEIEKGHTMADVIGIDEEIGYIGVDKAMGGLYRTW